MTYEPGAETPPICASCCYAQNVRASNAKPVMRNGQLDTPATIRRLQEMHANTYAFNIDTTNSVQDWNDLRLKFAPAAQAAGINVWVYLVPPSECPGTGCSDYGPFEDDYRTWVVEIANFPSGTRSCLPGSWTTSTPATTRNSSRPARCG